MSIPKICGLETEYGLLISGGRPLSQEEAAAALLEECTLEPMIPWDTGDETPGRDARYQAETVPNKNRTNSIGSPGFLLANGARLYIDHGHPEYATPECRDARALVASDKAGERLLERCRRQFSRFLPLDQSIRLFKNNSDGRGHSYGCHENYTVTPDLHRRLFEEGSEILHAHLVPFLVSRTVVCGAGKVGSENRRPPVDYQISQRADFFETLLGIQTMARRPIVNTRDEPHADRSRFRRLHVITGDTNMAEISGLLKVGTLQLLLAMLEDGAPLPDLRLADPLAAMVSISHDPKCQVQVPLEDSRRLTAVEIQLLFAEAAGKYLASGLGGSADGLGLEEVHAQWTRALENLSREPLDLASSLDWVIKWRLLEEWRECKGLDWTAAGLKELDILYHEIDPKQGLYHLLESRERVHRLLSDDEIADAEQRPISDTRAVARARLIAEDPDAVVAASWGTIVQKRKGYRARVQLANPVTVQLEL